MDCDCEHRVLGALAYPDSANLEYSAPRARARPCSRVCPALSCHRESRVGGLCRGRFGALHSHVAPAEEVGCSRTVLHCAALFLPNASCWSERLVSSSRWGRLADGGATRLVALQWQLVALAVAPPALLHRRVVSRLCAVIKATFPGLTIALHWTRRVRSVFIPAVIYAAPVRAAVIPICTHHEDAPLGLRQRQTRAGADDKAVLCRFELGVLRIRLRWPPLGYPCVDAWREGTRACSYSISGNHFKSGIDFYVPAVLSLRMVLPHFAASHSWS